MLLQPSYARRRILPPIILQTNKTKQNASESIRLFCSAQTQAPALWLIIFGQAPVH